MGSGGLCGLPGPAYEPGEWESQQSLGPFLWQPVLTLQHAWSRQQLGQEEVVSVLELGCWGRLHPELGFLASTSLVGWPSSLAPGSS